MAIAWRRLCLFAAFAEFVTTYGEEAAATFAEGLGARIRNGEFSLDSAAPVSRTLYSLITR